MALKMNLSLSLPSSVDDPVQTGDASFRRNCRQVGQLFERLGSGNLSVGPSGRLGSNHSYGTVTLSTTSGALVISVNGTSVTRTASGGDDTDGAALAASINANATLKTLVRARYATATDIITIESLVTGTGGNYALSVSGGGLTASGAAMTLGADDAVIDFRSAAEKAWSFITATHTVTGAVGATVGGTTVTVTAPLGVGDTVAGRAAANQSLRLIANAINADATTSKWVVARTVPNAFITLTDTTAGALTVTVNDKACTVTATTTEDDVGALLVAAVNAQTAVHGCVARYVDATNNLYVRSVISDKRVKLAVSGAGMGTSAVGGVATQTISIDGVTADVITVTVGGIACTITGAGIDEDTTGASLVTAINALVAQHGCVASYVTGGGGGAAGTLTVKSMYPGSAGNQITLAIAGAGKGSSAVTAALLDSGYDRCELECLIPGVIGNAIALVASGTGITAGAALLSGGSESRVSYSL